MSISCERIIPGQVDSDLYNEHISRYLFAKQFVKDKEVLDLGCGTGYGSKIMAEAAHKVVGVDISMEAINYAKERSDAPNVSFHIEDCSRLGIADKSFDVVVSFEVIEHIKDHTELINEAKRVLTDDGVFILSTPNKRYTEEKGETSPYHIHEFYYEEFNRLLKGFFEQVQILAENHCSGISISSPLWKEGDVHSPLNANIPAIDNVFETPSYFIAVCYKHPKSVPAIRKLFYVPSEANILREKERHIKALQEQLKEFDERTEWAIKLDTELKEKTKWAHDLDIELQEKDKYLNQLQREYDERSKWALKLDTESKEKEKYLGKLQHEFDEKARWASQLDLTLKESNQALSKLRQEYDERTRWALELDAELKDKIASLRTLNQCLQEKDQIIIQLQEDIKKKTTWVAELQKELESIKNTKLYKFGKKIRLIKI